jgi:hypothetical protein
MASEDDLLQSSGIREVSSPLSRGMLSPPESRLRMVQFNRVLTDTDYRQLADWLSDNPGIQLRAYGSIPDLEFLRFFPHLRKFSADGLYDSLESLDGLKHLRPDLHTLSLGATRKKMSLQPLSRFTGLRRLYLEKHTKDIDVLAGLTSLTSLTLCEISLPDLSLLLPLTELRALELAMGGTRDLSLLPRVGQLEYLDLVMIRGLEDVRPVADMPSLRYLSLYGLKRVTALPADLSRAVLLDTVALEVMRGLTDLAPLLTAPALRRVALVNMTHLEPAQVAVLADHPQLRYLIAGLGSDRKNRAVRELVPLPEGDDEDWGLPSVVTGDD